MLNASRDGTRHSRFSAHSAHSLMQTVRLTAVVPSWPDCQQNSNLLSVAPIGSQLKTNLNLTNESAQTRKNVLFNPITPTDPGCRKPSVLPPVHICADRPLLSYSHGTNRWKFAIEDLTAFPPPLQKAVLHPKAVHQTESTGNHRQLLLPTIVGRAQPRGNQHKLLLQLNGKVARPVKQPESNRSILTAEDVANHKHFAFIYNCMKMMNWSDDKLTHVCYTILSSALDPYISLTHKNDGFWMRIKIQNQELDYNNMQKPSLLLAKLASVPDVLSPAYMRCDAEFKEAVLASCFTATDTKHGVGLLDKEGRTWECLLW